MDTTLEGRRVLVVGATSGIGAAFAKAVAAAAARSLYPPDAPTDLSNL